MDSALRDLCAPYMHEHMAGRVCVRACVRVRVCACVRVCVCACVCATHAHTRTHTHTHTHRHTQTHTDTHRHTRRLKHTHSPSSQTHTHTHTHRRSSSHKQPPLILFVLGSFYPLLPFSTSSPSHVSPCPNPFPGRKALIEGAGFSLWPVGAHYCVFISK